MCRDDLKTDDSLFCPQQLNKAKMTLTKPEIFKKIIN